MVTFFSAVKIIVNPWAGGPGGQILILQMLALLLGIWINKILELYNKKLMNEYKHKIHEDAAK